MPVRKAVPPRVRWVQIEVGIKLGSLVNKRRKYWSAAECVNSSFQFSQEDFLVVYIFVLLPTSLDTLVRLPRNIILNRNVTVTDGCVCQYPSQLP